MVAKSSADMSALSSRQLNRNRWAIPLAAIFAIMHSFAGIILAGWFYWIVPRAKWDFDQYGVLVPAPALSIIHISDLVVNYWYALILVAPVAVALDFLITWWITRQIGRRFAVSYGLAVLLLFMANLAISQNVLNQTMARVLGQ